MSRIDREIEQGFRICRVDALFSWNGWPSNEFWTTSESLFVCCDLALIGSLRELGRYLRPATSVHRRVALSTSIRRLTSYESAACGRSYWQTQSWANHQKIRTMNG